MPSYIQNDQLETVQGYREGEVVSLVRLEMFDVPGKGVVNRNVREIAEK